MASSGGNSDNGGALSAQIFRSLSNSMKQNQAVEFSKYASLGTVDASGFPSVRNVCIRSLEEDPVSKRGALLISTDARSVKTVEFALSAVKSPDQRAHVEVCWFFPLTREQYRLRCHVALIASEGAEIIRTSEEASIAPPAHGSTGATPTAGGSAAASSSSTLTPSPLLSKGLSLLLRRDPVSHERHVRFWRSHNEVGRSYFEMQRPGTVKIAAEKGDLDRYQPQPLSDDKPSFNFLTVLLLPYSADLLKLPRFEESDAENAKRSALQHVEHHHHDTEMRKKRGQTRWKHVWDEQKNEWNVVELNP